MRARNRDRGDRSQKPEMQRPACPVSVRCAVTRRREVSLTGVLYSSGAQEPVRVANARIVGSHPRRGAPVMCLANQEIRAWLAEPSTG
jgi:hypothetical protein